MAAVVAVVGVVAAFWVLSSRPRAIPVPPSGPATSVSVRAGPAASPSAMTSGSAAVLIVDVAGKVRRPGIYRLALGSRVDDAIRAAGGVLSGVDLATVNLAAVLVDGQQVAVGVPAAPGGAAGTSHAAGSTGGGPVRLNTATIDQLETLPGVGPVLAQHILDWRAAHGGFASVAQLDDVPGIGTTKFAELRPLVTV
jgi:competence protein ComEA